MAALHCEVSLRTDCVRFSLVDIPIYGIYILYVLQTASQGRDHLQTACHAAVCQFRSDCRHDRVPGDCSGRWFEKFHYNGSPAVLRALPVVCLLLVRQRGLRAGDTNNKHLNHAFISLISLIYVEQNSFHLRVRLRLAQFRCEMQENSLDTHDKCGTSFPFYRRRIYGINSAEFHIYYQQIILDCSCAQTNVQPGLNDRHTATGKRLHPYDNLTQFFFVSFYPIFFESSSVTIDSTLNKINFELGEVDILLFISSIF